MSDHHPIVIHANSDAATKCGAITHWQKAIDNPPDVITAGNLFDYHRSCAVRDMVTAMKESLFESSLLRRAVDSGNPDLSNMPHDYRGVSYLDTLIEFRQLQAKNAFPYSHPAMMTVFDFEKYINPEGRPDYMGEITGTVQHDPGPIMHHRCQAAAEFLPAFKAHYSDADLYRNRKVLTPFEASCAIAENTAHPLIKIGSVLSGSKISNSLGALPKLLNLVVWSDFSSAEHLDHFLTDMATDFFDHELNITPSTMAQRAAHMMNDYRSNLLMNDDVPVSSRDLMKQSQIPLLQAVEV